MNKMNLILSGGYYFLSGSEKLKSFNETIIPIPSSDEITHFEVWLTGQGISVLSRVKDEDFAYDQLTEQIDKLAWLSVPANCTDLSYVDVHFVKVVG